MNVEVFQCHGVVEVARNPVCLLDQQNAACAVALKELHQLGKLLAAFFLCRLHILERLHDTQSVSLRVFAQQLGLRIERISILLFAAGYASVDHGFSHDNGSFDLSAFCLAHRT
ncbi:MAG: hypothetical protein JSS95_11690 [Acidobacteria bacterium]|nr:hypothetical protein [Acidobacteriota bacterium]